MYVCPEKLGFTTDSRELHVLEKMSNEKVVPGRATSIHFMNQLYSRNGSDAGT